jgi:hypothetical protein
MRAIVYPAVSKQFLRTSNSPERVFLRSAETTTEDTLRLLVSFCGSLSARLGCFRLEF